MARFYFLATLTPEALGGLVENPTDRKAAVKELVEAAGGSFGSFSMTRGIYDGVTVAELPDFNAAAAFKTVVITSGVASRVDILEDIPNARDMLGQAKELKGVFRPPTQ
ncbi:MAG: GYD domain-containing protein [Alphaproteobacteria bacterium]